MRRSCSLSRWNRGRSCCTSAGNVQCRWIEAEAARVCRSWSWTRLDAFPANRRILRVDCAYVQNSFSNVNVICGIKTVFELNAPCCMRMAAALPLPRCPHCPHCPPCPDGQSGRRGSCSPDASCVPRRSGRERRHRDRG